MSNQPALFPLLVQRPRVVNTPVPSAQSALNGWNPGVASLSATFVGTTCPARTTIEFDAVLAYYELLQYRFANIRKADMLCGSGHGCRRNCVPIRRKDLWL